MSEITSKNIVQDERLREQNFGIHENIPIDKWIEMAIKAKVDPLDLPPESGETNVDVRNRTREFLKNAISKVSYFIIHLVFNQSINTFPTKFWLEFMKNSALIYMFH